MATATVPIPSAPSDAEQLLEPQVTRWREEEEEDVASHEGGDLADGTGLAPRPYASPQLLPRQHDADQSWRSRELLIALQSWEGVVLKVDDDSFLVRLIDVVGEKPDEEVRLAKDELCNFDLELLEPGAILYWTIGYREKLRGARERVSRIRLRRVPAWTESQLREARDRAASLARELGW